jgi:sulfate transport system ATP-binding protein
VGLPGCQAKYPAQLSGGQQQRIALARALATAPDLLLLDEPLSALDAIERVRLRGEIRALQTRLGVTTIMVTHDQEEAFELADRVVVMGAGRIEQIGHADAIHDHPATPFVARFMGATVELPVTLLAGRAEGAGLDLSALPRRALPDGPARLFIRPEDIIPVADVTGPWTIISRMSNGAHLRLVMRHPDLGEAEADVPRRAVDASALTPDATVHLKIEAGTLFPAEKQALPAQEPPKQHPARLESIR